MIDYRNIHYEYSHEIFIIVGVQNRTYWYYSDANTVVIDS